MWESIWLELRAQLEAQPRCEKHPEYPHVRTMIQKVVNDIKRVGHDGVVVRSHRTKEDDFIEADRFKLWWEHPQRIGSASLKPGDGNKPQPWRSKIVGAICVRCLPVRLTWVESLDELRLNR
jgi:hypothetical protein